VISFLIQNGIPVTLYIDDGLMVGSSKARVIRRYKFPLDVFDKAGLLISFEKYSLPEDASTRVEFLGVCIDTVRMCVFASPQKIKDLRAIVATALWSYDSIPFRKLASVVGKLVSLEVDFRPCHSGWHQNSVHSS
jgi:hypothetical protein